MNYIYITVNVVFVWSIVTIFIPCFDLKIQKIQLKWTRICTRDGLYLSSYHLTIEIFTFLCSVWSHFSISNLMKFHINTYHTNSCKNEKTYRSRQCYNGLTHLEMFFCLTFTANCIYFAQKSFSRTWTMHKQINTSAQPTYKEILILFVQFSVWNNFIEWTTENEMSHTE